MISILVSALEASSKPAGASFLEVLAGTSAQPSNDNRAAGSNVVERQSSDAGDRSRRPQTSGQAQDQARIQVDPEQIAAAPVVSKSSAVQVVAPPAQAHTNASAPSRTTESPEKTPAHAATPIASIPAPVEVLPIAAPAVPCPISSTQSDNHTATQTGQTSSGAAGAQTPADDERAPHTARAISKGQDTQDAQGMRSTAAFAEPSEPTDNSAIQSGSSSSGSNLSSADSSASASMTPIALPMSGVPVPDPGFLPSVTDVSQSAAGSAQSGKITGANSTKPQMSNATPPSETNQTTSSAASPSPSRQSAQTTAQNNSTAQHPQSQAAQAAPAAQGQANSAAPQIQAIPAHSTTHDVIAVHGRADGAAEATRASEQPAQAEVSESAGASGINTANVIQKMSETEMRVGMHSADFGDISIRTSVSQQQMTAQISVDHGDLGRAITAHIPAMEAKLGGDFGIRALVQVSQSGMSFSGERGASPQKEQAQPAQAEGIPAFVESGGAAPQLAVVAGDGYRLDIRA